jgi:hypothetical protein
MENIHDLDQDQLYNLKNMLTSWNVDDIRIALTLLNNANFENSNITQQVNYLMNECPGLRFAVFSNIEGGHRVRFHFEDKRQNMSREQSLYVDDESETMSYTPLPYPWDKMKINNGRETNY